MLEVTLFVVFALEVFQSTVFSMTSSEECFATEAAHASIVVTDDHFGLSRYEANLAYLCSHYSNAINLVVFFVALLSSNVC